MPLYRKGVTSVSKSSSAKLTGDVTLSEGTNVTLTQTGNDISIAASGGGSGSPGGSNTQVQYNNAGSFGGISGATSNGTVVTLTSALATTAFSPSSNDGAALGSGTASFSDLFLASGGVINFNNGDAIFTHSLNQIALSGANFRVGASSYTDIGASSLTLDDTVELMEIDVNSISYNSGDVTLTFGANLLTIAGGDVRVSSPGTNADSVVTLNGTQTLANKTLTTPTIASFTNATHNHTNAAGGGQITDAALSSAVTVAKGGTGNTSLTSGNVLVGAGTSAVTTTKAAPTGDFVGTSDSQTLTNKTIDGDNNTIVDVSNESLKVTVGFYATTTQSFANGGSGDVTTYTEVADYGSDFDNTTGVFTAPVNGLYHFDFVGGVSNITSANGRFDVAMIHSAGGGTTVARGHGTSGSTLGDPTFNMSITIPMTASETMKVTVNGNNTGGTEAFDPGSFSGFLVGKV